MADRTSVPPDIWAAIMQDYARVNKAVSSAVSGFVKVADAGKGWTELVGPDGGRVRRDGPRNWRNNNPGNLEYGKFAKANGAIGSDGRFAVFPDYETGRTAKEKLLFESPSYREKTISEAISRYAPSSENNTTAYTNAVAKAVGVSADTPISALDAQQRQAMLNAMERVEGFKAGKEIPVNPQGAKYIQSASASGQGRGMEALVNRSSGQTYTNPERVSQRQNMTPNMRRVDMMMDANTPGGASIRSGYRSPRVNARVGGAPGSEHTKGNAIDYDISGMSDAQKADFVERARMTGATRIGAYSGQTGLHVDYKPVTPSGTYAADVHPMFNKYEANMPAAPDWFKQGLRQTTVPTPTSRPDPSSQPAPSMVASVQSPPAPPPAPPPPPSFPSQPNFGTAEAMALAPQEALLPEPAATPFDKMFNPSISQYQLAGETMARAGISGLDGRKPLPTRDIEKPAPSKAPEQKPVQDIIREKAPDIAGPDAGKFPDRPAAPKMTSGDFWAGRSNAGMANNGSSMTRDNAGTVRVFNPQFGTTNVIATNQDMGQNSMAGMSNFGQPVQGAGGLGGLGGSKLSDGLSGFIKNLENGLNKLFGGPATPQQGGDWAQDLLKMNPQELEAAFAPIQDGLAFPNAPADNGMPLINNSISNMNAISPAATNAILGGNFGLF